MAKMHIIAKAALTFLGIYGIVTTCRYLSFLIPSPEGRILPIIGFSIFAAAIAFFFIFKNNSLTHKLAGPGEILNPGTQTIWLITSLRLVLVFCGLIIFSTSITTIIKILLTPVYIRPMVNEIFVLKRFPTSLELSLRQWSDLIFDLGKAGLAIYLLYGAPHFVRWQLKYSFSNNQPNPAKTERIDYE